MGADFLELIDRYVVLDRKHDLSPRGNQLDDAPLFQLFDRLDVLIKWW